MKKIVFILFSLVIIITSSCDKEEILENSNITNLRIYPNPSNGVFYVSFNLQIQGYTQTVDINIINKYGEVFSTKELTVEPPSGGVHENGAQNIQLNLENSPEGIYFVEIKTKDGVLRKELILLN